MDKLSINKSAKIINGTRTLNHKTILRILKNYKALTIKPTKCILNHKFINMIALTNNNIRMLINSIK
jgi:hypothetical protein